MPNALIHLRDGRIVEISIDGEPLDLTDVTDVNVGSIASVGPGKLAAELVVERQSRYPVDSWKVIEE
jgi:hypothetical protein